MKKIAKFTKVSFNQYLKDLTDIFGAFDFKEAENIYNNISLPKRATKGSAGYDFFSPIDFSVSSGESIRIPTGIRAQMDDGWVLKCYPRSGLGFKFRLQLDNTVGIIDSDYYNAPNEGHIIAKISCDSFENKTLTVESGKGFMQGVFVEYGITVDDDVCNERTGGFGSTDNSK